MSLFTSSGDCKVWFCLLSKFKMILGVKWAYYCSTSYLLTDENKTFRHNFSHLTMSTYMRLQLCENVFVYVCVRCRKNTNVHFYNCYCHHKVWKKQLVYDYGSVMRIRNFYISQGANILFHALKIALHSIDMSQYDKRFSCITMS